MINIKQILKVNMITFENVLEIVSQLPREQQEMLLEIVRKRMIETRRQEIMAECQEALTEYRTGKLQAMSATQAIADLRHYLQDNEDE